MVIHVAIINVITKHLNLFLIFIINFFTFFYLFLFPHNLQKLV